MDINIKERFFKPWFQVDGTLHSPPMPTGSYVVELMRGDPVSFGLLLPTFMIDRVLWAAVGYVGSVMVGVKRGTFNVVPIPFAGAGEISTERCWDLCFTTLTSSDGGYSLVFVPPINAINIHGDKIYYTVYIRDLWDNLDMPATFLVGHTPKRPIHVEVAFKAYRKVLKSMDAMGHAEEAQREQEWEESQQYP